MRTVVIATFLFCIVGRDAAAVTSGEIKSLNHSLQKIQSQVTHRKDCLESSPGELSCDNLTDDFCNSLWNREDPGNMTVHDGQIRLGSSSKSGIKNYVMDDYEALAASALRLPADLRQELQPLLDELKVVLVIEADSKNWYAKLSDVHQRIKATTENVAVRRAEHAHPGLASVPTEKLTTAQKQFYTKETYLAQDQILEAKYAQHPNWLRVEKAFKQAQDDLLKVIDQLTLPENQKNLLRTRISTLTLRLPFSDPTRMGAGSDCSTTRIDAFYRSPSHALTLCAGRFNSYQSESSLYFGIAHEISHSIDPTLLAKLNQNRTSPIAKTLNAMKGARGPHYSCDEWHKLTQTTLKPQRKLAPKKFHSFQKLYTCLHPVDDLIPFSTTTVRAAAQRQAREVINAYETTNDFSKIAQTTTSSNGSGEPNEMYMRPDVWLENETKTDAWQKLDRDAHVMEIFTQSLACQSLSKDGRKVPYSSATASDRATLTNRAMRETSTILQVQKEDWFTYCGRTCQELQRDLLSVDVSEHFADWAAGRALGIRLTRKLDLHEKRETVTLATARYCPPPEAKSTASELALIEKAFTFVEYPDERQRRLSVFTPGISQQVRCRIENDEQGFGQCNL